MPSGPRHWTVHHPSSPNISLQTLLDILSLRKTLGMLTGQVLLNGKQYTKRACHHLMAYVPQVGGYSQWSHSAHNNVGEPHYGGPASTSSPFLLENTLGP